MGQQESILLIFIAISLLFLMYYSCGGLMACPVRWRMSYHSVDSHCNFIVISYVSHVRRPHGLPGPLGQEEPILLMFIAISLQFLMYYTGDSSGLMACPVRWLLQLPRHTYI